MTLVYGVGGGGQQGEWVGEGKQWRTSSRLGGWLGCVQ